VREREERERVPFSDIIVLYLKVLGSFATIRQRRLIFSPALCDIPPKAAMPLLGPQLRPECRRSGRNLVTCPRKEPF